MKRTTLILGFVISLLAATGAYTVLTPAVANATKVPPVTGTVGACYSGVPTFKPPLTTTAATRATTMTITVPVNSFACGQTNISGGKAPVNGGSLKLHWTFPPGLTCSKAFDGEIAMKGTATLKFTNNSGPKPVTVATLHLKLDDIGTLPPYSFVFESTLPTNKTHTKPFDGESYRLDVGFSALGGPCGTATPVLVAGLGIN